MTNPRKSPVAARLLVSRPGLPKPCNKPLKTSPFECSRDPVTGRWITYFPQTEKEAVKQVKAIADIKAIASPIANPIQPIPLAKQWQTASQILSRHIQETLEAFRQWGKSVAFALRIYSKVHNIRKIFTEFWIVAR
ncbi:MAG: hypothetical protein HY785_01135 [Oscillatoriophycideae cyanobacterium NC_groundwater_1537_Pr4_S-0.65um_50_18]|nr:hypothetical protein [Oscillatoriophycideae cyanobacterium NC_groundwater_1537_Pr4_S-0.65um_50_18]